MSFSAPKSRNAIWITPHAENNCHLKKMYDLLITRQFILQEKERDSLLEKVASTRKRVEELKKLAKE